MLKKQLECTNCEFTSLHHELDKQNKSECNFYSAIFIKNAFQGPEGDTEADRPVASKLCTLH